jgi:amidase
VLLSSRVVASAEFPQVEVNKWFSGLLENPSGVRSLADLIKFNDDNKELEEPEGYAEQPT